MTNRKRLKWNQHRYKYPSGKTRILTFTKAKYKKWKKDKEYSAKDKSWIIKRRNIKLLISVGDYKHVHFDIILKRVFSEKEYRLLLERSKDNEEYAHTRIRDDTIKSGISLLIENKHYGLASMLRHNVNIEYVVGGEYTWTNERPQPTHFIRFEIRGKDRLEEIKLVRKVPEGYDTKQKKLEEEI